MRFWMAAVAGAVAAAAAVAAAYLGLRAWAGSRSARQPKRPRGAARFRNPAAPEIKRLVAASEAKLRASLRDVPVCLLIGDAGSGKTSLMVNSGLQPQLLAGQPTQGAAGSGAQLLNVWLVDGAVAIEVAAKVWKDAGAAATLLRALRRTPLCMALTRKGAAPRSVIACIPADLVASRGRSERAAAIRPMREFLLLASRRLGAALPVYAVLTRADAIRGFQELVFNLRADESLEVLGASLDGSGAVAGGGRAEAAEERLDAACGELIAFLQTKRAALLVRDFSVERARTAYEFPREIEKLRGTLVAALVDLCRPGPLPARPALRGFYFTGARRTIRSDGGSAADFQFAAQPPASGEVEEWLFARRLMHDVIFADPYAAAGAGGTSQFRDIHRAAVCWTLTGIVSVFAAVSMISFLSNYRLERSLTDGGRALRTAMRGSNPTKLLAAIDDYRRPVDRLLDERERVPIWSRWGLYQGRAVFAPAAAQFCNAMRQAVAAATEQSMPRTPLQAKSPALRTYARLRAIPEARPACAVPADSAAIRKAAARPRTRG